MLEEGHRLGRNIRVGIGSIDQIAEGRKALRARNVRHGCLKVEGRRLGNMERRLEVGNRNALLGDGDGTRLERSPVEQSGDGKHERERRVSRLEKVRVERVERLKQPERVVHREGAVVRCRQRDPEAQAG